MTKVMQLLNQLPKLVSWFDSFSSPVHSLFCSQGIQHLNLIIRSLKPKIPWRRLNELRINLMGWSRGHIGQGLSTAAQLTFGMHNSLLWERCLSRALQDVQQHPWFLLNRFQQHTAVRPSKMFPDSVKWQAKSLLVENHWSRYIKGSQVWNLN